MVEVPATAKLCVLVPATPVPLVEVPLTPLPPPVLASVPATALLRSWVVVADRAVPLALLIEVVAVSVLALPSSTGAGDVAAALAGAARPARPAAAPAPAAAAPSSTARRPRGGAAPWPLLVALLPLVSGSSWLRS